MNDIRQPIAAGRCVIHAESVRTAVQSTRHGMVNPTAGVRISQPSTTEEGAFIPSSDVYIYLANAAEAQRLAAYFSQLARTLQGTEE